MPFRLFLGSPAAGGAPPVGSYVDEVIADSPIAYWRLGEPSGTNANDEIGTADGTYTNTPTLGVDGLQISDSDTAVTFDRASAEDVRITANMPAGGSPGCTIEAWASLPAMSIGDSHYVFSWGAQTTAGHHGFLLQRYDADNILAYWYYYDGTAARNGFVNITSYFTDDSTTHHVVGVHDYSAETFKVYIDGNLTETKDFSAYGAPVAPASGLTCRIAGYMGNTLHELNGTLDEVAVYQAVLSETRIGVHYTAGTSGFVETNAPAGLAAGTGSAPAVVASIAPQPAAASGAGAATSANANLGAKPAAASGTGTVPQSVAQVGPSAGTSAVAGAAYGLSEAVAPGPTATAATGAAQAPTSAVASHAGDVAVVAAAYDSTVQVGKGADAETTGATIAATTASPSLAPVAAAGAVGGAAQSPSAAVGAHAGLAAIGATAEDTTAITASFTDAQAELAEVSATAQMPSVSPEPEGGHSTATAAARALSAGVAANAAAVAALAAAYDPAVVTGVYAYAGLAAVTAGAFGPATALGPMALPATVTATARNASARVPRPKPPVEEIHHGGRNIPIKWPRYVSAEAEAAGVMAAAHAPTVMVENLIDDEALIPILLDLA